jgi:hypothetical protein
MLIAATPMAYGGQIGYEDPQRPWHPLAGGEAADGLQLVAARGRGHDGAHAEQFDTPRGIALPGYEAEYPDHEDGYQLEQRFACAPAMFGCP